MSSPDIAGFSLDGYDFRERLEGGMGYVFKSWNASHGSFSAVKVLKPEYSRDPVYVERMHREIEVLGQLDHPGIVRLGASHCLDGGESHEWHYLTLDWVEGTTLEEVLVKCKEQGRLLAIEDVSAMVVPLCEALEYAHTSLAEPVIHRDLKPSNIILESGNFSNPVLTDFGIVYIESSRKLTQQFSFVGAAEYMSPEHASKHGMDARSDLYSLGVVLYEMVTGEVPFPDTEGNPLAVLASHIQQRPVSPHEYRPGLPDWLEYVILRLLQKRPEDRFSSAREVAAIARSQSAGDRLPSKAAGLVTGQFDDEDLRATLESHRGKISSSMLVAPRRRPIWPVAIGALLLTIMAISAGVAFFWLNQKPPPPINRLRALAFLQELDRLNDERTPTTFPRQGKMEIRSLALAMKLWKRVMDYDVDTRTTKPVDSEQDLANRVGSLKTLLVKDPYRKYAGVCTDVRDKLYSAIEQRLLGACVAEEKSSNMLRIFARVKDSDEIAWGDVKLFVRGLNALSVGTDRFMLPKLTNWEGLCRGRALASDTPPNSVTDSMRLASCVNILQRCKADLDTADLTRQQRAKSVKKGEKAERELYANAGFAVLNLKAVLPAGEDPWNLIKERKRLDGTMDAINTIKAITRRARELDIQRSSDAALCEPLQDLRSEELKSALTDLQNAFSRDEDKHRREINSLTSKFEQEVGNRIRLGLSQAEQKLSTATSVENIDKAVALLPSKALDTDVDSDGRKRIERVRSVARTLRKLPSLVAKLRTMTQSLSSGVEVDIPSIVKQLDHVILEEGKVVAPEGRGIESHPITTGLRDNISFAKKTVAKAALAKAHQYSGSIADSIESLTKGGLISTDRLVDLDKLRKQHGDHEADLQQWMVPAVRFCAKEDKARVQRECVAILHTIDPKPNIKKLIQAQAEEHAKQLMNLWEKSSPHTKRTPSSAMSKFSESLASCHKKVTGHLEQMTKSGLGLYTIPLQDKTLDLLKFGTGTQDWYMQRFEDLLEDHALWERHVKYVETWREGDTFGTAVAKTHIAGMRDILRKVGKEKDIIKRINKNWRSHGSGSSGGKWCVAKSMVKDLELDDLAPPLPPDGVFWSSVRRNVPIDIVGPDGKVRKVTVTYYTNCIGMDFAYVAPGVFKMGSSDSGETDELIREITFRKGFYMAATEVTRGQYLKVMGSADFGWEEGTKNYPANGVSWEEAKAFCKKLTDLSKENRDDKGKVYSLPRETQWEYACRAGTTSKYYCGDTMKPKFARYANDGRILRGKGKGTMPVGSFPANPWCLYDMCGNVWEWCEDGYDEKGQLNDKSIGKVIRGGSFRSQASFLRSAKREHNIKRANLSLNGFRVIAVQQ